MVCAHHIFTPFNLTNYRCAKSFCFSFDSYACWNKLTVCLKRTLWVFYCLNCMQKNPTYAMDLEQGRAYSFPKFIMYIKSFILFFLLLWINMHYYYLLWNMMLWSKANYSLTLFPNISFFSFFIINILWLALIYSILQEYAIDVFPECLPAFTY